MVRTLVHTTLRLRNHQADEHQSSRYYRYAFTLPESCGKLTLSMETNTRQSAQVPLILFDPLGQVRLMRAANATTGPARTTYTIMPSSADNGCIPGALPAGTWKLLLYKRRMLEDVDATITVTWEPAQDLPPETQQECPVVTALREHPFSQACPDDRPGWYCGELHTHSSESTGYTSAAEVVRTAKALKLDFLALTDHFTASHWLRLQELSDDQRPLLLQSVEVSGDFGHANVHGLTQWQNPLVDNNEELTAFLGLPQRPTMEHIADQAHAQGGLFCLNHALSGIMGWRYREFPLEKADLYEVFCTPEMQTTMLYTTHWDQFLIRGMHLTGVGSSDSHHPTQKGPWQLGQVLTWIYAQSLSQKDLLAGLKRGHAYVGIQGVRMAFSATSHGVTAQMGDTLELEAGQSADFTLTMFGHPRGNLFLYADGMLMDVIYYDQAGDDTYTFALPEKWIAPQGSSYVRIEFHEAEEPPKFYGLAYRDYKSARLISNPIWLKRKESTQC